MLAQPDGVQTQSALRLTPVEHHHSSVSRLRWTFLRGTRAITCEVALAGEGARCEVHVIPGWDAPSAHVESADSPISALWRHAQIAKRLREAGWSLVARSSR